MTPKKSFSLACPQMVVANPGGGLRLAASRVKITGAYISEVETVTAAAYPERLHAWQRDDPHLEVYDHKIVSPAFNNPHTHLAMSFFRGIATEDAAAGNMVEDLFFKVESQLTADDVRAFARMGAYECLLHGVGTVWDHYYHGLAIAEALADTGLTGVVAPTLQDLAGPGKDSWQQQWQDTHTLAQTPHWRERNIFAAFGPHATDTVSGDLWQQIAAASADLQLPIHCHLAQSWQESQRLTEREGCSPLAWLDRLGVLRVSPHMLLVHSIFVDDGDLALLNGYNSDRFTLGFCPFSALIFCFPADVRRWQRAGIPFVVGTDCVASNDSMNVQKELRYLAGFPLQQLSLAEQPPGAGSDQIRQKLWHDYATLRDPSTLLAKVWELPGRMHPAMKVGKIAVGQLANLAIWDERHPALWPGKRLRTLAYGDTSAGLHQLIVGGKKMGEAGNYAASLLASPSYRAAEQEASQRLKALLQRCHLF